MLSWNVPPDPPRIIGPWFLWKLIVGERHQRHGVGHRIVEAVADIVRNEGAAELLTSYSSGDGNPGGFHRRLGFVPTGDVDDHGETIVSLDLGGGGAEVRIDTPGSIRD